MAEKSLSGVVSGIKDAGKTNGGTPVIEFKITVAANIKRIQELRIGNACMINYEV